MTSRQLIIASSAALALLVTGCGRHRFGGEEERSGRYHGEGRGGPGHGMMGMMAMEDPIARLLDHQAALRLTSAQVTSLIVIDDKLQADNRPIRQRMAGWHMAPGERGRGMWGRGPEKPDSAQMAARMAMHDSAMTAMHAIRENNWRAISAAYALLNADQINTAAMLEGRGPGMDGERVLISRFRGGPGGGPLGPGESGGFGSGRGTMRGGAGGPPGTD